MVVDESQADQVSALAALDEPNRRRLYEHVVQQPGPVSRDDAATALDMARATAAFHLDRLVDEGLLRVSYQRRTGRTGPGAGRTAKLYSRSTREVAVSLPERRYDLAGRLLASALAEAERTGASPRAVLERRAHAMGRELACRADPETTPRRDQAGILRALEAHGFEPRREGPDVVLANCPFHALAQEQTELVCGMNHRLLDGFLNELDPTGWTARLDPRPGSCCVRFEPAGTKP